ncbi:sigma factor-like helix-turn-helix DNA-binding protein [Streptomyces sp. NPDC058664]|uniref:sigma factor-like helix-turn-helix DNA-binding protein n=1 Tax=unclassified Streptomyces TaxID=2593676 RepID=UPI0036562851
MLIKDRRRKRHAEIPAERLPDVVAPGHEDETATGIAVREALRLLSPAQRAVPVLRYCHQLSEEEIAGAPGCSRGTVKSRAARAPAVGSRRGCRRRGGGRVRVPGHARREVEERPVASAECLRSSVRRLREGGRAWGTSAGSRGRE